MALRKQVEFTPKGISNPVIVANAYHKVVEISGSKKIINAVICAFESKESEIPIFERRFSFVPTMDLNFIAQAYIRAKQLDEFISAEDC